MKKITLIILIAFTIPSQGQDKLLSSINQIYNGSSWTNNFGYNYEYDNNNLISETSLQWENGQWVNQDKTTYTYNANNKVTEVLYQEWNKVTNQFENPEKEIYTYLNGKVTEILFPRLENSQWVTDGKATLGYDANNLLVTADGNSWDGSQWITENKETFTYTNNKLTGDFGETFKDSQWQNDFRGAYVYTNNKMTSFINEDWSNGAWSQSESTVFVVDPTGNRTSKTSQYTYGKWRDVNQYDTTSLMSSFAHPFADKTGFDYLFEDFPYVNKILSTDQYNYDVATSEYILSNRTTYNYNSSITLSVEQPEIVNAKITVFPNPTTSIVNLTNSNAVTIDKVVVFDVTGKIMLQQNQNTSQVNVEKLAEGLYILEAYSGKDKFTSKFVKK